MAKMEGLYSSLLGLNARPLRLLAVRNLQIYPLTPIDPSNIQFGPVTVTTKPKALPLAGCIPPSLVFFKFIKAPSLHHVNASSSPVILAHSISLGWILWHSVDDGLKFLHDVEDPVSTSSVHLKLSLQARERSCGGAYPSDSDI